MHIQRSTAAYEAWVRTFITLNEDELTLKHQQMALSPFAFLRATFYHWMLLWKQHAGDLAQAPEVLSVGDIHIENFGTWRDAEGRLAWGVNDFDEAITLPYTHDLVRLVVSAWLAMDASHFKLDRVGAAAAVLSGYHDQLKKGGEPFVIAEKHAWMAPLALSSLRDPEKFWAKLSALPVLTAEQAASIPAEAHAALLNALPAGCSDVTLHSRTAGLGSLGRLRVVALANYHGGKVAREVKALLPSAANWAAGTTFGPILSSAISSTAIRCPDPHVHFPGSWVVRRLAPDCSKIELGSLPAQRDEKHLLKAMGQEMANIHLGAGTVKASLLGDLDRKGAADSWLIPCAERMETAMLKAQAEWVAEAGK
jgi:Uncharacterized protein conserved in bacteria (DUF2252)